MNVLEEFSGCCILIVDDDERFRERLSRALTRRELEVHQAEDATGALALAAELEPELALVDLRMPGESGLWLVSRLRELEHAPRIVVLTGYGSIATALEAVRLGATHYLQKPADVEEILRAFLYDQLPHEAHLDAPSTVPSLARTEWEHINRVLADCQGNIRQAARLLGIHRRTLQRKLAKFPTAR